MIYHCCSVSSVHGQKLILWVRNRKSQNADPKINKLKMTSRSKITEVKVTDDLLLLSFDFLI
jgi:hypothetical protein